VVKIISNPFGYQMRKPQSLTSYDPSTIAKESMERKSVSSLYSRNIQMIVDNSGAAGEMNSVPCDLRPASR